MGKKLESQNSTQTGVDGRIKKPYHKLDLKSQPKITAIVLAAGQSLRMGHKNKLLQKINRKSILRHVLSSIKNSRIERTIVVLGHEAEKIKLDLQTDEVSYALNLDYELGISTSIRTGIEAIEETAAGVLIALGDMPGISPAIINTLVDNFQSKVRAEICVPVYEGQPGNPVLWSRKFFSQLASLNGDVGGKKLIEENSDVVAFCSVDTEFVHLDVDTQGQLESLRASFGNLS